MKNFWVIAIVVITMVFSSCTSDNNGTESKEKTLILKLDLNGGTSGTRLTEAPGATGKLTLNDGYIYVINNAGAVSKGVALDVTAATSPTGQTIAEKVPSDSRVYILGNIPSTLTPSSLTTLDQIRAHVETISASTHNDYTKAMMANHDGQAVLLNSTSATTAEAYVQLSPLYARMELAKVQGDTNVVSFTVTGLFVDSYYSAFTLAGASSGAVWTQNSKTDFTGNIGDSGNWPSVSNSSGTGANAPNNAIAVPATGQSWVYHMAGDGLPRFIVRVTNIVYNDASGKQQTISDTRYITVTGYSGSNAPTKFERGKIYQIESLLLQVDKAALTPNPTDVTMTVKAKVVDWVPTQTTPVVGR